jgi:hypothetical protein
MALYDLGQDKYWVARAEDLLFLEVSVDRQADTITMFFPTQSVMETTPLVNLAPGNHWQTPLTAAGFSALGGHAGEDQITFALTDGLTFSGCWRCCSGSPR